MSDPNELGRSDAVLSQQATIAEFGARALEAEDLDELLTSACAMAAEGLAVERAKILVPQPPGDRLLMRAGIGWGEGVIGKATIGADLESPAGYALQTGWPVVSGDLAAETRFRVPSVLADHHIRSAVNVIIRAHGKPFGVLEVDHTEPRAFTKHDVNFLQSFANLLAAAVNRVGMNETLRTMAEEKAKAAEQNAVLLRELQHRVNNNLGQIGALLRLQRAKATSPDEVRAVDTIQSRLNAMGVLYRSLSVMSGDLDVRLGAYLRKLIDSVTELVRPKDVTFELSVPDLPMRLDVAVPIGLIVNEFVTNSLKHAFAGTSGVVTIGAEVDGSNGLMLKLADNGRGLPRDRSGNGLGLLLIERLAAQIKAEVQWSTDGGTKLTCRISGIA